MKKFLSVLLALAVAFTFTFGSTMSAFATYNASTGYDSDTAKQILAIAYEQAKTSAAAYKMNYDSGMSKNYSNQVDSNGTKIDDITVFTISADSVKKGLESLYVNELKNINGDKTSLLGSGTFNGSYDAAADADKANSADVALVKAQFLSLVKTDTAAKAAVEKASFEEYKTFLIGLVDKIDTSVYTETKDIATYTSLNGNTYETSAAAVAADIAWIKAAINNAEYKAGANGSPSATSAWETDYENLYTDFFNGIITIKENKDDVLMPNNVTSLDYTIVSDQSTSPKTYSTKKSEAAGAANLDLAKATAKATLSQAISAFETGNNYNKKYDELIAAYREAETYMIENATTAPINLNHVISASSTVKKLTDGTTNYVFRTTDKDYDYIKYCADAKALKDEAAQRKATAALQNREYDDVKAAKDLTEALMNAYKGQTAALAYNGEDTLTAGAKAALKAAVDYSEVIADDTTLSTTYAPVYTWKDPNTSTNKKYYEKEWTAVKAAVDAYCTAIDAAANTKESNAAMTEYKKAIKAIADDSAVRTGLGAALTGSEATKTIAQYFTLTETQAKAADKTVTNIYITWDGINYVKAVSDSDANVKGWYITKGARTAKEATALYADAQAVINAYKTSNQIKAEAEAVVAQIAALPEKVTLADKAAVIAAYDAYAALAGDSLLYVTNVGTLKADVKDIEKLEATAGKEMVAKLPTTAKVTAADRDAIIAVADAYKAYKDTKAYKSANQIVSSYNWTTWSKDIEEGYMDALMNAEYKEIADAYAILYAKWSSDKLTAEDAAACKDLQAKVDSFVDNWACTPQNSDGQNPALVSEITLAQFAKVVEALAPKYTDVNAKADLLDMSRKLTIWRTSKTSIKVTAVGSVANIKDNGYTVKYSFYKKAPGATSYKLVKTTTSNKYTYTNLKKGTNKFQVKVKVYDADGKLVATKMTYYRAAKIK